MDPNDEARSVFPRAIRWVPFRVALCLRRIGLAVGHENATNMDSDFLVFRS